MPELIERVLDVVNVPEARAERPLNAREALVSPDRLAISRIVGREEHRTDVPMSLRELAVDLLQSLEKVDTPDISQHALWARLAERKLVLQGEWEVGSEAEALALSQQLSELASATFREWMRKTRIRAARSSEVSSFESKAYNLYERGYIDTAIDLILDSVDELFRRNQFAACDAALMSVAVDAYPTELLLALLSATAPAKTRLATRADFYNSVAASLIARGETDPSLLYGLK